MPNIHFRLGRVALSKGESEANTAEAKNEFDWLEVKWPNPSGKTERHTELPVDRYITIVEGQERWK
ncbi:MAG TPA: hypothetical protein VJN89_04745 [Candidatus Acidoferrum sp.]|nr:hypothetical protein [Candidatus Acidoferrum sp.]